MFGRFLQNIANSYSSTLVPFRNAFLLPSASKVFFFTFYFLLVHCSVPLDRNYFLQLTFDDILLISLAQSVFASYIDRTVHFMELPGEIPNRRVHLHLLPWLRKERMPSFYLVHNVLFSLHRIMGQTESILFVLLLWF